MPNSRSFAVSCVGFLLTVSCSLAASSSPHQKRAIWPDVDHITSASGLAWYKPYQYSYPGPSYSATYQCFAGNINNYPTFDQWLSFDALYEINHNALSLVNTEDVNQAIRAAIIGLSYETNVDARLILAMVMQESSGSVNVPCTGTPPNCGLLQAANGSISFNPSNPSDPSQVYLSIKQMLTDGILGTDYGPGLISYINDDDSFSYTNNLWPGNPYAAARCYNSGHVDSSGDLDLAGPGTTGSYVNDVANRLTGWDGTNAACLQTACGLAQASEC